MIIFIFIIVVVVIIIMAGDKGLQQQLTSLTKQ